MVCRVYRPKRKNKVDKPLRSMRPRTPANPPSLATPAKADPCSNKEDRKSYIPLQPSLYTLKTYFMRILVRTRRIPNGDQEALKKCVFTTVNYCSTQKATLSQLDFTQGGVCLLLSTTAVPRRQRSANSTLHITTRRVLQSPCGV